MKPKKTLRWRITFGVVAFQTFMLVTVTTIVVAAFFGASPGGVVVSADSVRAVAHSISRDINGQLAIYPNEELERILATDPDVWFIARNADGATVGYGSVPVAATELSNLSWQLKTVDIRGTDDHPNLTARLERITVPIGTFSIIFGGGGFLTDFEASLLAGTVFMLVPILILILITLIGIPPFIRLTMRSISRLSRQMDSIDFHTRGTQLSTIGLPQEILPVVERMNDALRRIDAGFELTERFFMNAAHELRTPIAILQVRLDALPDTEDREKLRSIVRRLTALVNQLMNIERFRQNRSESVYVDLAEVLSEAAADLAPYAVSNGYDLALEKTDNRVWVKGDRQALDRMVVNLIQNAVQHGLGTGAIIIRLDQHGVIEVEDPGPGISPQDREKVFEPFYRANPHGSGAGLGLKMVYDIVRAHSGEIFILDAPIAGTIFRVSLPVVDPQEVYGMTGSPIGRRFS